MKSKITINRRKFVQSSLLSSSLLCTGFSSGINKSSKKNLKLSLNAYSFNKELSSGKMDLFDIIDFCVENGFDAIDPTGYYFPGYPAPPSNNVINEFKRRAFLAGIEISGTGIRNNFSGQDISLHENDLQLIENWCVVARNLGVPLIRIFAGKIPQEGIIDKKKLMNNVIASTKKACQIGERYGIMIALQNHNDFLKSSQEIIHVLESVNSNWLGLHLDIGSLAYRDPYDEIRSLIQYAITWQIKEKVWLNGKKVDVNYDRLMDIILSSNYVGYLPLETLNTNPMTNLPIMVREIRKRL